MEYNKSLPQENDDPFQPLHLTEPKLHWGIDDGVIFAVLTAAVWSVEKQPGIWNKMMRALDRGAESTKEGTANSFLFRAMVVRLVEEFYALEADES